MLCFTSSVDFWSILGIRFLLDPSTVPPSLHLSNSSLTITYQGESPPVPPPDNKLRRLLTSDPGVTLALPEVCADVVIARGQYYWEVDVCNSSVYRIGKNSLEFVEVGSMPANLLLPETLSVSQQDCTCSGPHSNLKAHVASHYVHSATKWQDHWQTAYDWLSSTDKVPSVIKSLK